MSDETPPPVGQGREGHDRPPPFNLFALVAIAVLLAAGWWLVDRLSASSKLEDCVNAGRKNCVPIDTSTAK
jgi:hypothetical protein